MPERGKPLSRWATVRGVTSATVTPLASILGSGLLIIAPILERSLGVFAVFGAIGICAFAWLVGTVIRHNVTVIGQQKTDGTLDSLTGRLGRLGDAVIVVAYVISVALYLRIMAQYMVGFFIPAGSAILEAVIACASVVLIMTIGIFRGFKGLDRIDRISLAAVLLLTTVLGGVLLLHDGVLLSSSDLRLPSQPPAGPLEALLILGGLVITVQGFETVRYLGHRYDAVTRVRASRAAQLVSASIYIGFVAVATPVMGLGTAAGPDITLLNITDRIAPWLALPLVLSAVLSQFSAAIADTEATKGNLTALNRWFSGPRPYLISGVAAIAIAATIPTFTLVTIASRAFAAYYAVEAAIAFRTTSGFFRKCGFAALALLLLAITLFAQPAS
ncbi:hypothetical protein AOC05_03250 [Arthrobacter alpinus]|uniref:Amino acid permease n=1 Tax=Arthrobacter alpinus TaxID=656366 RepID=A0A0M4QV73_9MICC|nr:hypothetical protein [Arthrobacter alpinus]ALE91586.1 hypothetical protein AOC05_03250 [Arthrobacter alpinus]